MDINTKKLLAHLKASAKKRDIECTITGADLDELSFPVSCPILRMPLDYDTKGYSPNKPSIDRTDSSKGYISGNLQVISFTANRSKNNLTDLELKKFALYYK